VATGTLDELLAAGGVRVRVTGLQDGVLGRLRRFGPTSLAGEWLSISGLDEERVPEVVEELVRAGARVYAVEPSHESLEERFMALLTPSQGEHAGAAAGGRHG
jgi:hypothetical protein